MDTMKKTTRSSARGFTLVEVMVGLSMFVILATSISATAIQMRRQAENTMYQTLAQTVAEGVLEQVRQLGFSKLTNFSAAAASAPDGFPVAEESLFETTTEGGVTVPSYQAVRLKFVSVNSSNHVAVQQCDLYWGNVIGAMMEVGARENPIDPLSNYLGVLVDVDYRNSSGSIVISPRRYMKMKMSIVRSLNSTNNAVTVALNFQWAIPDNRPGGGDVYFGTRELRTVVSNIPTY